MAHSHVLCGPLTQCQNVNEVSMGPPLCSFLFFFYGPDSTLDSTHCAMCVPMPQNNMKSDPTTTLLQHMYANILWCELSKQSARAQVKISCFCNFTDFRGVLHKGTMDNIIVPPHLNAEAYRNEFDINISNAVPYLDYLRIHQSKKTYH